MKHRIVVAQTPEEIERCYPIMVELRPHLKQQEFIRRIFDLQTGGYRLAVLETAGQAVAAAGYRVQQSLARGTFLYVDDFVTRAASRRQGYGAALFTWLVTTARGLGCDSLHLDSGPTRADAHRFYEGRHMIQSSRHYMLSLND